MSESLPAPTQLAELLGVPGSCMFGRFRAGRISTDRLARCRPRLRDSIDARVRELRAAIISPAPSALNGRPSFMPPTGSA